MKLLTSTALVAVLFLGLFGTPSGGQEPPPTTPTEVRVDQTPQVPVKPLRNGCVKLYHQAYHRAYARTVYHKTTVSKKARKKLALMRHCATSAKAARNMRKVERIEAKARADRAILAALTPYGPCHGGYWAVPCEIIGGESGGSWTAYNSNGCMGPYQFCGWPVPWPVRTLADKIKHHLMARSLWRGGAGCSHWTQTSSSC